MKATMLFLLLATMLSACSYRRELVPASDETAVLPQGSVPGFNDVFQAVFKDSCLRCHDSAADGAGGVGLATFEEARLALPRIEKTMRERSMPRRGMPDRNYAFVLSWIEGGAPREAIGIKPVVEAPPIADLPVSPPSQPPPQPPVEVPVEPPPAQEPVVIRYAEVLQKVLEPKCTSCHSASGRVSHLDFSNYDAFILSDVAQPGHPNNSLIVEVVTPDPSSGRVSMPPSRSRIPPLTEEERKLLEAWIAQGMQN